MKHSSSRRDFIKKSTLAATAVSFGITGCNSNMKNKIADAVTQEGRREQLHTCNPEYRAPYKFPIEYLNQ